MLPQLPITGIEINNAIGKRICKISRQTFFEFQVGEAVIQYAHFIQVEGLNE